MSENSKASFADILEKREVVEKLQKLSYVKVKVIWHRPDKTSETITYPFLYAGISAVRTRPFCECAVRCVRT